MNDFDLRDLHVRPMCDEDLPEVETLFRGYPYKDFQLKQLDIPKEKMVVFLSTTLKAENVKSACLREDGRLVGLVCTQPLPWMSQLLGAKMYGVQHLITSDPWVGYTQTMLNYILDQAEGAEFFDCRVASGNITTIQALENTGFRYVGNDVYLGRSLIRSPVPEDYNHPDCEPCPQGLEEQVLDLVRATHFHNRFMYDPEVSAEDATEIYRSYLSGFAFMKGYRSRIMREGGLVVGFILYKINEAFSKMVGGTYASLDFIGVRPDTQNAGVGEALNRAALYDLARCGATHVVVRTFGSNYPAIRICHKVGFKITSSDLHFHLWTRPRHGAGYAAGASVPPFRNMPSGA